MEATSTPTPPTSSNGSTGTAPTNQGPGTGTALEAALTGYLADQLRQAQAASGSYSDVPMPQAQAPQVTVVQAAPEKNSLPTIVAIGATVIGVASGVAYLMDRRKKVK